MTKNESAERVPIVQRTVSQVPENEKGENAASSSIPVSAREEEPSAEETSAAAEVKPEEVRMESPIVKDVMPAETKSIPEKKDPPAEEHPEDAQE